MSVIAQYAKCVHDFLPTHRPYPTPTSSPTVLSEHRKQRKVHLIDMGAYVCIFSLLFVLLVLLMRKVI